jgi:hypothetical protein
MLFWNRVILTHPCLTRKDYEEDCCGDDEISSQLELTQDGSTVLVRAFMDLPPKLKASYWQGRRSVIGTVFPSDDEFANSLRNVQALPLEVRLLVLGLVSGSEYLVWYS